MAQTLRFRRGTTAELASEAGIEGEIFIDTTKKTVVTMDGETNGGHPLARFDDIPTNLSELVNDAGYLDASTGFSGDYNDLSNLPTLFSGNYNDLYNRPVVPTDIDQLEDGENLLFSGNYEDLQGAPALSNVATSGAYSDLIGIPTIPETVSSLTNDENFISLTDLSVDSPAPAAGQGGIDYNSVSGAFQYTPPDLSSYLTDLVNDGSPSLGGNLDLAGYNIIGSGQISVDGIITGNKLQTDTQIVFEGGVADANETTLTVVNPTADRTITLPNKSGTVALMDDLPNEYTNQNFDVHINLATAGANEVLSWSGTDYAWVSQTPPGLYNIVEDTTPELASDLDANINNLNNVGSVGLYGTVSTNINVIQANPSTTNWQMYMPVGPGANGQVLTTDGSGVTYWANSDPGLTELVSDTTPQLGGDLDLNGNKITNFANFEHNSSFSYPSFTSGFDIKNVGSDTTAMSLKGSSTTDRVSFISDAGTLKIKQYGGTAPSGGHEVAFPDKAGTVAFTSDLVAGAQGVQGITGIQGPSDGADGAQGTTGADGAQGVQGLTGSAGDTGPQGTTGSAGDAGVQGVQGLIGLQGPADGPQGTAGQDGAQGVQGAIGAQGPADGPQGTAGADGAQGVQGVIGAQGLQGTDGTTGLQGADGTPGGTGLQGLQGIAGSDATANLTGYATESYVNTEIANLVDTAPATLDTLNELAAALGDDANFANTVTTQIGTKWTQDNTKITNWDTAYGWGDHSAAGYISEVVSDTTPQLGGDLDTNGFDITYVGAANTATLTFAEPTVARTLTLPNLSGTIALSDASNTTDEMALYNTTAEMPVFKLSQYNTSDTVGPSILFDRPLPNASRNGKTIGAINFQSYISGNVSNTYAQIKGVIELDNNPNPGGALEFIVSDNSTNTQQTMMTISGYNGNINTGVFINSAADMLRLDNGVEFVLTSSGWYNTIRQVGLSGNINTYFNADGGYIVTDNTLIAELATESASAGTTTINGTLNTDDVTAATLTVAGFNALTTNSNLSSLNNVDPLTPTDNDVLTYQTSTSNWVPNNIGSIISNYSGDMTVSGTLTGYTHKILTEFDRTVGFIHGYGVFSNGTGEHLRIEGGTAESTYDKDIEMIGAKIEITAVSDDIIIGNSSQTNNIRIGSDAYNTPIRMDGQTTFLGTISEKTNALSGATGVVTHNLNNGGIFDHTSLSADFTANFTNVPTTVSRTIGVALILSQGGTAYMPTAVQIDGTSQTILWSGGSAPSGTPSGTDVVSFTLIRSSSGTWKVIGSATSYS